MLDGASGAKIRKNRFGTDGAGTTFRSTGNGILLTRSSNVTIGGDTAADGNQIVTKDTGIGVYAIADAARPITGLKVRHNTIGTDASGGAALGTGPSAGVIVLASANGKATISDNLIVGTKAGVEVAGAGTAETVVSGQHDRHQQGRHRPSSARSPTACASTGRPGRRWRRTRSSPAATTCRWRAPSQADVHRHRVPALPALHRQGHRHRSPATTSR